MGEQVRLVDPLRLQRNEENPRLIFREEELKSLEESITQQGILVPLTVFEDGEKFSILDGERRWRCAKALKLPKVPVIVQPKPDRLQNLMMMFAIHNARKDWDPLPTALKLEELEKEFGRRHGRSPTEPELAGIASLRRGEVRRLKKLLALPLEYRKELLEELEKPRSQQIITVDHVIETTKAAESLRKAGIIKADHEDKFRKAVLKKFRTGVINNTVAPRKLINLARATKRGEIPLRVAIDVSERIIRDTAYSIDDAYVETIERADYEHSIDQLAERLITKIEGAVQRRYALSDGTRELLKSLVTKIKSL